MKSITDELYKAVELLIDKKLSELRFDRTVTGRIVKETDGGYIVAFEGIKVNAKLYGNGEYHKGDSVLVHLPQNNINQAYIG